MSELHGAVRDEIDAFRPDTVPPFSSLVKKQRQRRQRQRLLSGGAVAVVVLAGVALFQLPGTGGYDDRLASDAGEGASTSRAGQDALEAQNRAYIRTVSGTRLGRLTGVLGGDAGTGCLWLDTDGGRVTLFIQHASAVSDFSVTPAEIRDGGTTLARFGDRITLAGGASGDFNLRGCASPDGAVVGTDIVAG